jgi:N-acetyltransferase
MTNESELEVPRFEPRLDPRPQDVTWPQSGTWPPPADIVLRGQTVEVRPIAVADTEDLRQALDDEAVWIHLPTARPRDEAEMQDVLDRARDNGMFTWIVRAVRDIEGTNKTIGNAVGMSSFLDVSLHDARGEIGMTGYARDVWGTNVNPETKLLLLTHAFDELHWGRVQLKTDIRNTRSQQAIARLGAQYEGVLRRYQRRSDDTVRDTVMFSITAEDWPAVRARLQARTALS